MEKHYLNDLEKEKVIAFNEDSVMKEAVRKVLLERIYNIGVLEAGLPADKRNWAFGLGGLNDMVMDNSKVGELLKITVRALGVIEDAFDKQFNEFKRAEKPEEEKQEHI